MKYYSEISKIVNGALIGDHKMVISYTHLLSEKLLKDGEHNAAKGLTQRISSINTQTINSQSATMRPVPVEKDSRFSLADKSFPSVTNSVVFLSAHDQQEIHSFIQYINKKEQLISAGIPLNPTLLLYGEPGTGKSKLASNIAAQLNLPLVTARADALISSYLGSTAKNIRSLLEYAQAQPCVLFLDEFDAIAKARDDKNEVGELKRVVVSLLQNIDNLGDTILIAATNHQHLLDPAIWRRFHYKMALKAPTETVRGLLLTSLLSHFDFSKEDITYFIHLSEGLTGAEIEMATHDYLRATIVNDAKPDALALSRKLLQMRFSWLDFSTEQRATHMPRLKKINHEMFSGRVLGDLWGISASYVSKLLKGHNDGS